MATIPRGFYQGLYLPISKQVNIICSLSWFCIEASSWLELTI